MREGFFGFPAAEAAGINQLFVRAGNGLQAAFAASVDIRHPSSRESATAGHPPAAARRRNKNRPPPVGSGL
ncbi:hypothetical protein [Paenibacillus chitinolyticus]|uniref:hypothetical protein n=1 Tax=Paenibacillus chitinolyticus TaxID=79263 RepID=UPI00295F3E2F|nr:hypothetical protein [Paenibacillus chitinolyticus]